MNRTTALPVGDWPDGDMIAMYHVGGCGEVALFVTAEAALTRSAESNEYRLPDGTPVLPEGVPVCGSCGGEVRNLALSKVRECEPCA